MRAIEFWRRSPLEVAWAALAAASFVAILVWPSLWRLFFAVIWISLTVVYGFRIWRRRTSALVLVALGGATAAVVVLDGFSGEELWEKLLGVCVLGAMFLTTAWHARRRQEALRLAEHAAAERAALLDRQERFLHDASHELRTPVTIARGHLEIARSEANGARPEIAVALDELQRIERILERMLLLAKVGQPEFVAVVDMDIESFLEDVFMRWSEVAPRAWRLGRLASGTLRADPEALRNALDALLENAVRYTDVGDIVEVRSHADHGLLAIEVADGGPGISPDALSRIFDRFARGDAARTRAAGGVGLGLAIVDAIARAHGGSCTVSTSPEGSVFSLSLPGFVPGQPMTAAEETEAPAREWALS